jgi:8-oxo-dGTP diphosphatase
MEETGMEIDNVSLFAVTNDFFPEHNKHYATIWVTSIWMANEPKIMEPDTWINQEWRTFQDLPHPLFEPCWQNLRKEKPEVFLLK